MSQLVFVGASGGSTTLTGSDSAVAYNLIVPAASGTLLYQDLSGNITFTNLIVTGTLTLSGTTALGIPVGTTVQRPTSPSAGQIRYNSDGGGLYEGYLPAVSAWYKFSMVPEGQYTMRYLIVAGGGGSGGGGGGAGGAVDSSATVIPATVFTITVGAGGSVRTQGTNSAISGLATMIGGGAGNIYGIGGDGGSGGAGYAFGNTNSAQGPFSGGAGTPGQGYAGGSSGYQGSQGGGGGGATQPGGNGDGSALVGGNGGSGLLSTITGTATYYAGGGGGGCVPYNSSSPGAGGSGGGGAGNGYSGNAGSANTGGGAGGGGGGNPGTPVTSGTNGGSGIVKISVPTANYSGTYTGSPTISTSGSNTILSFTASGSYTA